MGISKAYKLSTPSITNELLASTHKTMDCVTCHNPHKRAAFAMKIKCEQCHRKAARDFAGSKMQRVGKSCVDCHMPRATKSAEAKGHFEGDVRTHLFTINLDPKASMFYKEGKKEFARGFLTVTSLAWIATRIKIRPGRLSMQKRFTARENSGSD